MDIGARIALTGETLRRAAEGRSSDLNETFFLAHCALMRLLRDDPDLSHIELTARDHDAASERLWRHERV
jgi:hypothetical protein